MLDDIMREKRHTISGGERGRFGGLEEDVGLSLAAFGVFGGAAVYN